MHCVSAVRSIFGLYPARAVAHVEAPASEYWPSPSHGIEIPDDAAEKIQTVGDAVEFIKSKAAGV